MENTRKVFAKVVVSLLVDSLRSAEGFARILRKVHWTLGSWQAEICANNLRKSCNINMYVCAHKYAVAFGWAWVWFGG